MGKKNKNLTAIERLGMNSQASDETPEQRIERLKSSRDYKSSIFSIVAGDVAVTAAILFFVTFAIYYFAMGDAVNAPSFRFADNAPLFLCVPLLSLLSIPYFKERAITDYDRALETGKDNWKLAKCTGSVHSGQDLEFAINEDVSICANPENRILTVSSIKDKSTNPFEVTLGFDKITDAAVGNKNMKVVHKGSGLGGALLADAFMGSDWATVGYLEGSREYESIEQTAMLHIVYLSGGIAKEIVFDVGPGKHNPKAQEVVDILREHCPNITKISKLVGAQAVKKIDL